MKLNKLASAVSISLVAVALTACGGSDDSSATNTPSTTTPTPTPAPAPTPAAPAPVPTPADQANPTNIVVANPTVDNINTATTTTVSGRHYTRNAESNYDRSANPSQTAQGAYLTAESVQNFNRNLSNFVIGTDLGTNATTGASDVWALSYLGEDSHQGTGDVIRYRAGNGNQNEWVTRDLKGEEHLQAYGVVGQTGNSATIQATNATTTLVTNPLVVTPSNQAARNTAAAAFQAAAIAYSDIVAKDRAAINAYNTIAHWHSLDTTNNTDPSAATAPQAVREAATLLGNATTITAAETARNNEINVVEIRNAIQAISTASTNANFIQGAQLRPGELRHLPIDGNAYQANGDLEGYTGLVGYTMNNATQGGFALTYGQPETYAVHDRLPEGFDATDPLAIYELISLADRASQNANDQQTRVFGRNYNSIVVGNNAQPLNSYRADYNANGELETARAQALSNVQYGRLTANIDALAADPDTTRSGYDTFIRRSFQVRDKDTADIYFYRGVDPTSLPQMEAIKSRGGKIDYRGHALTWGIAPVTADKNFTVTTPVNQVPTAFTTGVAPTVAEQNTFGNFVQATYDVARNSVDGSIYNFINTDSANVNSKYNKQDLVTFSGAVSGNTVIGTSNNLTTNVAADQAGSFHAAFYGANAQELGGEVSATSREQGYGPAKWGAVFGAAAIGTSGNFSTGEVIRK